MPAQRRPAPGSPDYTVEGVRSAAKACIRWAWVPLVLAAVAVFVAPDLGDGPDAWVVRYLSITAAAVLGLASVTLFAACAVLRALAHLIARNPKEGSPRRS